MNIVILDREDFDNLKNKKFKKLKKLAGMFASVSETGLVHVIKDSKDLIYSCIDEEEEVTNLLIGVARALTAGDIDKMHYVALLQAATIEAQEQMKTELSGTDEDGPVSDGDEEQINFVKPIKSEPLADKPAVMKVEYMFSEPLGAVVRYTSINSSETKRRQVGVPSENVDWIVALVNHPRLRSDSRALQAFLGMLFAHYE